MSAYLPWFGIVLAVVACVFRNGLPPFEKKRNPPEAQFGPMVALFVVALALAQWKGWGPSFPLFARGVYVGAFVVGVAAWVLRAPINTIGRAGAVFGLATAALAPPHWLDMTQINDAVAMQLGTVFGAGSAAFLAGQNGRGRLQSGVAVFAMLAGLAACDALGRAIFNSYDVTEGQPLLGPNLPSTGLVIGCALTLGGLLGGFIKNFAGWIVGAVVSILIMLMASRGYLGLADVFRLTLIGLGVGVASLLTVLPEQKGNLRFLMAAALWLAAATVAFSLRRGYGMSIVFAVGLAPLIIAGAPRALLAIGPFFGFVLFRVFREGNLEASKAFDIGQHYAMVGLLVGVAMVVLATEWRRQHRGSGLFGGLASAIWLLLAIGVPLAAAFVLGPKGVVGLVIGVGLGALVEGLQPNPNAVALSVAGMVGALVSASYVWLKPILDELTRDDKVVRMAWTFGLIAVAAGILAAIAQKDPAEVEP